MQQKKNIKELVTPLGNYPHLPYWATLKEALIQLGSALEDGINTVLVFNEAYKLIGILTPSDILRGIEPTFGHRFKERVEFWSDLLSSATNERMMETVKTLMGPARTAIDAEDSLFKALHIMVSENQPLLAIQEQGRIIGVLKLDDVFREIVGLLLNKK
ncbi:MAG: CBS domain-containing protein [Thermodesulfobacteriota bacterium]|jgi:CBS-domain-containing membrane protein|nr:MAG: CBS domain-containing protein [Thermodesulfobacteriota bacterium]